MIKGKASYQRQISLSLIIYEKLAYIRGFNREITKHTESWYKIKPYIMGNIQSFIKVIFALFHSNKKFFMDYISVFYF